MQKIDEPTHHCIGFYWILMQKFGCHSLPSQINKLIKIMMMRDRKIASSNSISLLDFIANSCKLVLEMIVVAF